MVLKGSNDKQIKKRFNKNKAKALATLKLIETEHNQIKKQTARLKYQGLTFRYITQSDVQELYLKRKDRKYASLIVELCSLVEQYLKKTYLLFNDKQLKKEASKSLIQSFEEALMSKVKLKSGSMKMLLLLRNEIVHNDFSLKKARKSEGLKEKKLTSVDEELLTLKSKELFKYFLTSVDEYFSTSSLQ